jgi:hypothetical protein
MKNKPQHFVADRMGDGTGDSVRQIQRMLAEKRPSDAVRLFLAAQERGEIPRGKKLVEWLRETDKTFARRILTVFTHLSCPFCKNGLVTCEFCEGMGHVESTRICETCVGLGLMLCSFCGGTGWSPIQSVPRGIRVAVLLERAMVALARLGELSRRSTPADEGSNTAADFKKLATLLLGFNRQVSVLEAVLVAADNYRSSTENTTTLLKKTPEYSRAALLAGKRMFRLIRLMADRSRRLSRQAASYPKKTQLYALRAEFYQSLVDKDLPVEHTGIGHPMMIRAIRHLESSPPAHEK